MFQVVDVYKVYNPDYFQNHRLKKTKQVKGRCVRLLLNIYIYIYIYITIIIITIIIICSMKFTIDILDTSI